MNSTYLPWIGLFVGCMLFSVAGKYISIDLYINFYFNLEK